MIILEKTNTGWRVRGRFKIGLHVKGLELLRSIQSFFNNIGQIGQSSTQQSAYFEVTKLDHLVNIIIPHFNRYSLESCKKSRF